MTRAEANADSQLYRPSSFRFFVRYQNLVPQYKRQPRPDLDADRKHAPVTIFALPGKFFVRIGNRLKQLILVPLSDIYKLAVSDEILFLPHDLPPPLLDSQFKRGAAASVKRYRFLQRSLLSSIRRVPKTSGLKQALKNIAAF
jgi:hypothetical protein